LASHTVDNNTPSFAHHRTEIVNIIENHFQVTSGTAIKLKKRKQLIFFYSEERIAFLSSACAAHRGMFHFRRAAFSSSLKAKVGSTLAKAATLRVNLNIDGAPITSRTHTHPSHSKASRLLTSSLSLGVPVPRATQCMRGV